MNKEIQRILAGTTTIMAAYAKTNEAADKDLVALTREFEAAATHADVTPEVAAEAGRMVKLLKGHFEREQQERAQIEQLARIFEQQCREAL